MSLHPPHERMAARATLPPCIPANGLPDPAIVATAHLRGWTVLTRNVRPFALTGVPAYDSSTLPGNAH